MSRISYITASQDPAKAKRLRQSLRDLSALQYWIFTVVDGGKGICKAYNEGARAQADDIAPGDIYGFVHDDVEILGNWRCLEPCLAVLENPKTGFLGVAGTRLLNKHACWWVPGKACVGMVAHGAQPRPPEEPFPWYWNVWPAPLAERESASFQQLRYLQVVALDGLFLFVRRDVFEALGGFDEGLTGYHFYDIDITLRAHLAGYRNFVMPLPVKHYSHHLDFETWDKARAEFAARWAARLPQEIILG